MIHTNQTRISVVQYKIKSIYNKNNLSVNNGFEYSFSYLVRKISYLQRAVNDNSKDSIKVQLIKSLSWLFSLANLEKIDIENSFIRKYPTLCPYCVSSSCVCGVTDKSPVDGSYYEKAKDNLVSNYHSVINSGQVISLEKALLIITKIYPANALIWKTHGVFFVFSKLLEEVGEIHEAYSRLKKPHGVENKEKLMKNLEEEFADVFVWLMSVWFVTQGKENITASFDSYYEMGCPVCCMMECECNTYSDRKPIDDEKESLISLKEGLEKLRGEIKDKSGEANLIIEKTLSSITVALDEDTNLSVKSVIADTKTKFEKLSDVVERTENMSSNGIKIFENIAKMIGNISQLAS
ncbi:hypothetical protein [Pectobacterium odoriferum]|uniref:hypothetical protein n=1 Tax=Pectobacterium odoriferum TaxID=78398 RepID=UPI00052A8687|nr:hypothetical protein [Pectobacterium odoriferum]AIU88982.1 hypothetical protein BCS7_13295 [Pectobacterium odoriferum]POE18647.1 hypothetical protein BV918_06595 [Pectobacterium odoriferum]POE35518.1 hypothetical protein BV922_06580 [Pectobacterium odoriferum]